MNKITSDNHYKNLIKQKMRDVGVSLSGEVYASIDEQGELTLDWDFGESVDSGEILIETESELYHFA